MKYNEIEIEPYQYANNKFRLPDLMINIQDKEVRWFCSPCWGSKYSAGLAISYKNMTIKEATVKALNEWNRLQRKRKHANE